MTSIMMHVFSIRPGRRTYPPPEGEPCMYMCVAWGFPWISSMMGQKVKHEEERAALHESNVGSMTRIARDIMSASRAGLESLRRGEQPIKSSSSEYSTVSHELRLSPRPAPTTFSDENASSHFLFSVSMEIRQASNVIRDVMRRRRLSYQSSSS